MRRTVGVLLLVVCLALPAGAVASTAELSGATLQIGGGDGQANTINVSYASGGEKIQITELGINAITAAGTCTDNGSNVTCPAGAKEIFAGLGSGQDSFFNNTFLPAFISGGEGPDSLTGGLADEFMVGGEQDDVVMGEGGDDLLADATLFLFGTIAGGGNDTLNGGAGEDTLFVSTATGGALGNDTYDGGADLDTLDASERTEPLTISEGNNAFDDSVGAGADKVLNAEIIVGGSAGDSITGGAVINRIEGRGGDDVLAGGGAGDELLGGEGTDEATYVERTQPVTASLDGKRNDGQAGENDFIGSDIEVLTGGFGADTLAGSTGADRINGGSGADAIDGLGGADTLNGDDGDDAIQARDGVPDTIACGGGVDSAVVDAGDTVAADCEKVDRPAVSPVPGPGSSTDTSACDKAKAALAKAVKKLKKLKANGAAKPAKAKQKAKVKKAAAAKKKACGTTK